MAAIAPSGEAALSNTVDVASRIDIPDASAFFDLERVASEIAFHATAWLPTTNVEMPSYRTALQLPDDLLFASDALTSSLHALHAASPHATRWRLDAFILADTQYSPCCVDEVAAEHFAANLLVHFGRSCLSRASHLPVVYAFGRWPLDVDDLVHRLEVLVASLPVNEDGTRVLVVYDVTYLHAMPAVRSLLPTATAARIVWADVALADGVTGRGYERTYLPRDTMTDTWPVVLVGPAGPFVDHASLSHALHPVWHYDPASKTWASPRSAMTRRYVAMQKARDADVIGVVVGTLGVANYIDTIAAVKRLIRASGKKYYTFVLGKLNVPKLANFMDIDCFVLVSCPESSLIESKEFYRPVVTPFELTMALDMSSEWTGDYKLAFSDVLPHMAAVTAAADAESPADRANAEPYFSLVTGELRTRSTLTNNAEVHAAIKDLVVRDAAAAMQVAMAASPAAQRLATREWTGLDTSVAREDKSLELVQGRFGNAARYEGEDGTSSK